MSFQRYPSNKDSGVEWLGEVPEHWEVRRLKSIIEEPLKYGANESAELDDRTLPRFVRITDIDSAGGLRDDTFKSLPVEIAEQYLLKEGDILLARSGATVGKSFIYSAQWGTACFAGYLIRARLKHTICLPRWLYYFCQTKGYWGYVVGCQIQATIQNVSAEKYANLYLPFPQISEQTQIAAFLDRETKKIDELVAEQRRLMELLKEKRQAVISHAVTKGLNPKAPMKSSGIEWLGDVPEHWEVKRLKYVGKAFGGLIYAPSEVVDEGNGTLVLRSSNVQNGRIVFDDNVYVTTTIPEKIVTQSGDILVCSRNGSRALIGKNAMIDDDSSGVTFGAFMMVFRSENNNYISHVFNSQLFKFQSGAFLTATINQL
ncbi:MAG: restriction endonuclease subunit S, partial [Methylococcaceae bacterium]